MVIRRQEKRLGSRKIPPSEKSVPYQYTVPDAPRVAERNEDTNRELGRANRRTDTPDHSESLSFHYPSITR